MSAKNNKWLAVPALLLSVLVACQTQQTASNKSTVPDVVHKHAHAMLYTLDAEQSSITLKVYRDGPLARFGHNHVITATQISGTVYRERDALQSDVELSFPASGLLVDQPQDRAQAGAEFPGVLPPEAIAGTRQNMLGPKLLAAEQFPNITLRTVAVSGQWPDLQLLVEVKLREFTGQLAIPVHLDEVGDRLSADGQLNISQVQLGLSPYSVLGGGLRVRDTIDASFHLVANRNVAKK